MKYRKFSDKISFSPSALGFGLMRLPLNPDGTIDFAQSIQMVRFAIDHGVNYLDTAYMYHGGESEKLMAQVLKDGYREKVKIADKMPLWSVKEKGDLDRIFFDQLKKLEVEKIDFYMCHAMSAESYHFLENGILIPWLEKKRADGYIDYIGFSFHDELPVLKKIVDAYDWDFCMVQFNLVDAIDYQAGLEGVKYAHQKGLGVIAMESLRGGQLTLSIPPSIKKLWSLYASARGYDKDSNPAMFLLEYVWDFPEIALIISGMSTMEQVVQNISYASDSNIYALSIDHQDYLSDIRDAYKDIIVIHCTKCDYCQICPVKIPIPYIFDQLNEIKRYENQRKPAFSYSFVAEEKRANKCIACGQCLTVCPQKLPISELMKKCSKVFDEKLDFDKVF
jgi:hypothetical protein